MEVITIDIAKDFHQKLGGRYIRLGENSGEEFYVKHLERKFEEAKKTNTKLHIYMDGTNGYGSSFLDESFGELARKYSAKLVDSIIIFHTQIFEWHVQYLKEEIWGLKK